MSVKGDLHEGLVWMSVMDERLCGRRLVFVFVPWLKVGFSFPVVKPHHIRHR